MFFRGCHPNIKKQQEDPGNSSDASVKLIFWVGCVGALGNEITVLSMFSCTMSVTTNCQTWKNAYEKWWCTDKYLNVVKFYAYSELAKGYTFKCNLRNPIFTLLMYKQTPARVSWEEPVKLKLEAILSSYK